MIKQVIAIVALSIGIIASMSYAHEAVQLLLIAHDWVADVLTDVFSGGHAGNLIRGLIALLTIPVVVGLIPTIAYWAIRRNWFPYFMEIVWVVWFIQAGALIVLFK
jgi:thiamine biosynthesis protein ThiC